MEVFEIWNKRVTKFREIMFKIKKFIMVIKTCKACKYKFELSSHNFRNFFNFLLFNFFSNFSKWFLVLNQSSWTICLLILDSNWVINWKSFCKYSLINTSRKLTPVFSNSLSRESRNPSLDFPIEGFFELNNPSGIIWYALETSNYTIW